MSGEVFVVAEVAGVAAVVAAGFAARTALAGTTMALDGVAALGDHMNGVVARAEEAHRSACAWSAVASGVLDRNARLAVLAEACARAPAGEAAGLAALLPEPVAPEGRDPGELLRWCGEADELMRRVDGELEALTARVLTEAVFGDLAAALGAALPGGSPGSARELAEALARHPAVPEAWRGPAAAEELAGTLTRVLARLSPHVSREDREAVRAAALSVAAAAGPVEARTRVVDVRHRVQLANAAATAGREAAVEAARLLQALQADAPEGAGQPLRAQLADVVAGRRRMDARLRAEARAQCSAAVAAADERHVRRSLLDALGGLGYRVDEGFETLRPLRLSKDGWDEHAVMLVTGEGGEVRSMVVRTVPASDASDASDAAHEKEWCDAFDQARERLADQGVATSLRHLVPPGSRPAPTTGAGKARPAQERAGQERKTRSRERP